MSHSYAWTLINQELVAQQKNLDGAKTSMTNIAEELARKRREVEIYQATVDDLKHSLDVIEEQDYQEDRVRRAPSLSNGESITLSAGKVGLIGPGD